MRSLLSALFLFVLGCLSTQVSRAQQIPVIEFQNAVFDVSRVGSNVSNPITLSNADSSITFQLENAPLGTNRYAGAPLDLQMNYGSVRGAYSGVLNGVYYERLYFGGMFGFQQRAPLAFPFKYNRQKFARVAQVSLVGVLYIHDQPVENSQPIAKAQFNLQGVATATLQLGSFTALPDGVPKAYYNVHRIRYELVRPKSNRLQKSDKQTAGRETSLPNEQPIR